MYVVTRHCNHLSSETFSVHNPQKYLLKKFSRSAKNGGFEGNGGHGQGHGNGEGQGEGRHQNQNGTHRPPSISSEESSSVESTTLQVGKRFNLPSFLPQKNYFFFCKSSYPENQHLMEQIINQFSDRKLLCV
jgi:hypothetical protein